VFIVSNYQRNAKSHPSFIAPICPTHPSPRLFHLQQTKHSDKRTSSSSQHRQRRSCSARSIIAPSSGTSRRLGSRPSSSRRRIDRGPSTASNGSDSPCSGSGSVGRRGVRSENCRASESGRLVLVVGVVVEIGRSRGVDARDHRAGGRRGDGSGRAATSGTSGGGVEGRGGEAAGAHDFVDV
jgi:hypothetical protein